MNCLFRNRDNSKKLPFDVMNIIYEYADPMKDIRKQIINKEYNLDEIMYRRHLKQMEKDVSQGLGIYISWYNEIHENNEINETNMYEEKYRAPILSHYKLHILYYERFKTRRILGLDRRHELSFKRNVLIMYLRANGIKNGDTYSTEELYKKWLEL